MLSNGLGFVCFYLFLFALLQFSSRSSRSSDPPMLVLEGIVSFLSYPAFLCGIIPIGQLPSVATDRARRGDEASFTRLSVLSLPSVCSFFRLQYTRPLKWRSRQASHNSIGAGLESS